MNKIVPVGLFMDCLCYCYSYCLIIQILESDFFIYLFFSFQLWDINMDSGPVATFQVHEHLRPRVSSCISLCLVERVKLPPYVFIQLANLAGFLFMFFCC